MALALNNLKRVDMPLNKETKPNQDWNRVALCSDMHEEVVSLRGVVANVLDCDIVVSKFEIQSR